jgi:hypothetical protein
VTQPDLTEKQFQRQVADLAHLLRWQTYHPYLSIHSERGWPDLTLIRPPRLLFAELKTAKGKTTVHQDKWLGLLGECPGVEVYLWRPADWDAITEALR